LVIHYYLTEEYLVNFVMDKDAGLLLNNFPRELMYLLNLSSNQVYVNINFSNVSTHVKIIAMALEQSDANNLSTFIIDATGGHMFAGTPMNSMKIISNSLATNGGYPWNTTITTGLNSITLTTNTASSIGYYFNFSLETFGGNVTSITLNGISSITYNY
jgi:hypothetical protein